MNRLSILRRPHTLDGSIVKQETGLTGLDKVKAEFAEKALEKVSKYDSLLKKGSDNLSYQNNDPPFLTYLICQNPYR